MHTRRVNGRRVAFAMLVLLAVVWAIAIVLAPVALRAPASGGQGRVAALVYLAGSLVCHQMADRSFHTAGVQWPVCARCTGLYLGAAAGLLLWPVIRRRVREWNGEANAGARRLRRFTVAVVVPTALTVGTAALGLFDPSNGWRALMAAPLGAWVAGVLAAVTLGDLT